MNGAGKKKDFRILDTEDTRTQPEQRQRLAHTFFSGFIDYYASVAVSGWARGLRELDSYVCDLHELYLHQILNKLLNQIFFSFWEWLRDNLKNLESYHTSPEGSSSLSGWAEPATFKIFALGRLCGWLSYTQQKAAAVSSSIRKLLSISEMDLDWEKVVIVLCSSKSTIFLLYARSSRRGNLRL